MALPNFNVMKKIYALFIAFPIFYGVSTFYNSFSANRAGAPAGHTNSPGDGKSCTTAGCHSDNTLQTGASSMFSSTIPTAGWEPGKEYDFTLYVSSALGGTFGFQLCVQDDLGAHKGTLTSGEGSQITGTHYLTHTNTGAAGSNNERTWLVKWKAPNDGTRKVKAYVAFNAANGDGTATGDLIYVVARELLANTTGIRTQKQNIFRIFPNPCHENLMVSGSGLLGITIRDFYGRILTESLMHTGQTSVSISVESLKPGAYVAEMRDIDNVVVQSSIFIKY